MVWAILGEGWLIKFADENTLGLSKKRYCVFRIAAEGPNTF